MPDFQLNFEPRFYVGFEAMGPDGPGLVAIDSASDHPDACARADWYAKREPHRTFTTYIVVDIEASKELDAWLKDHRGGYDQEHGVVEPAGKLFTFDFGDDATTPARRPRGGRR